MISLELREFLDAVVLPVLAKKYLAEIDSARERDNAKENFLAAPTPIGAYSRPIRSPKQRREETE
jgi:hypothetical protein